jgi:hypothetical protein
LRGCRDGDRQAQLGAEHRARELGDQLFGGVGRGAEPVLEIAVEAAA